MRSALGFCYMKALIFSLRPSLVDCQDSNRVTSDVRRVIDKTTYSLTFREFFLIIDARRHEVKTSEGGHLACLASYEREGEHDGGNHEA
jgi:hypothetical protein